MLTPLSGTHSADAKSRQQARRGAAAQAICDRISIIAVEYIIRDTEQNEKGTPRRHGKLSKQALFDLASYYHMIAVKMWRPDGWPSKSCFALLLKRARLGGLICATPRVVRR